MKLLWLCYDSVNHLNVSTLQPKVLLNINVITKSELHQQLDGFLSVFGITFWLVHNRLFGRPTWFTHARLQSCRRMLTYACASHNLNLFSPTWPTFFKWHIDVMTGEGMRIRDTAEERDVSETRRGRDGHGTLSRGAAATDRGKQTADRGGCRTGTITHLY